MTHSLAERHEVTVMTLGPAEAYDGQKLTKIELLDRDLPSDLVRDIEQLIPLDQIHARMSAHLAHRSLRDIGLPEDPAAFDVLFGYQDQTG